MKKETKKERETRPKRTVFLSKTASCVSFLGFH